MKPLFIANDPSIFREGSGARTRMRAYAEEFGELHILARASRNCIVTDGPLTLHGVLVPKLFAPLVLGNCARALIRKNGIDIVSAQDPFEHGWAALRATKGTPAALHVQAHTDFLSPWFTDPRGVSSGRMRALNRQRVRIADRVLPHADGIRVVSERIKTSIEERYAGKLKTVPVVIPLTVSSTVPEAVPLPEPRFPFSLVTVSRLEAEKRIDDILTALAQIHLRYPGVGLYIIGDGRERERLTRRVRALGLADAVRFLGDRKDAWGLLRSAHGFIQASAYEGYGRTLLEAALARVPIITTDVGIVGEVFTGFRDVLSIPPRDPNGLAAQIMGLVEDSQTRHGIVIHAELAAKAHLESLPPLAAAVKQDLMDTVARKNLGGSGAVIQGT
ncbi:MAG TPA: glycosyltransferase [Candidatus Paceibacterota bacterium]|nr:glycosyltransferase [Candidatus Paceibacterota bacterium]